MCKQTGAKRLFFDIETSPNIGVFWRAGFKQTINPENIVKERRIICICYKWEGQKKVYSLTWDKNQCDKKMLQDFIQVTNEADELVGHNGDKYDLPFVRTRCLFHDIEMFPVYTTIDTLKIAKSRFAFNSNKLDYISKFLGRAGKIRTTFGMWLNITLKNDLQDLMKMVTYCKGDVRELEYVFSKLHKHYPHKTHRGVFKGRTKSSCPNCSSYNTQHVKTRVTAAGSKRFQLQCQDCGTYHTVAESHYTTKMINNNE